MQLLTWRTGIDPKQQLYEESISTSLDNNLNTIVSSHHRPHPQNSQQLSSKVNNQEDEVDILLKLQIKQETTNYQYLKETCDNYCVTINQQTRLIDNLKKGINTLTLELSSVKTSLQLTKDQCKDLCFTNKTG